MFEEWYSTTYVKHVMLKGLFGHVLKFNSVVRIEFILFNFQMVMRIAFLVTPTIVYRLNHKIKYKLYPTYEYARLMCYQNTYIIRYKLFHCLSISLYITTEILSQLIL